MNNQELVEAIQNAQQREEQDDHLSREEREAIVEAFAENNSDFQRSEDVDSDFVDIIF
jgi:hypothetical protein